MGILKVIVSFILIIGIMSMGVMGLFVFDVIDTDDINDNTGDNVNNQDTTEVDDTNEEENDNTKEDNNNQEDSLDPVDENYVQKLGDNSYVRVESGNKVGSGFIYKDKYVITNSHVVEGSNNPTVKHDSGEYSSRVLGHDPVNDVAVLELYQSGFGSSIDDLSKNPTEDSKVFSFGYDPDQDVERHAEGKVMEKYLVVSSEGSNAPGITQISNNIVKGFSGGPVLDSEGDLIGINRGKSINGGSNGYIVSTKILREVVPSIISGQSIKYPDDGLTVQTAQIDKSNGDNLAGVMIKKAEGHDSGVFNTYEQEGNMKTTDIIISVDDVNIKDHHDYLMYLYFEKSSGDSVNVELWNNRETRTVEIVLG